MAKVERFEDLKVWKEAVEIAVDIYSVCKEGKLKTDFGTKDQLQRAAMSISNNIAEGYEYDNTADFIRFLKYAKGSAGELRNQIYVLNRIGYVNDEFKTEKSETLIALSKQLASFIKYLKEYQQNKKI